jgi:hypothetical protein
MCSQLTHVTLEDIIDGLTDCIVDKPNNVSDSVVVKVETKYWLGELIKYLNPGPIPTVFRY